MLIQKGTNTKLGRSIAAFSLPALSTCPGKTKYCESVCYATSGFFNFKNVKGSLANNYTESLKDSFVKDVLSEIKASKATELRIHPSGDFYSEAYINKWIEIVQETPNVRYWVYSRSWSIPELSKSLKILAEQPNVQFFASVDETTIGIPEKHFRLASLVKDWELVSSDFVRCPNLKNKNITCDKCTYCFKPSKTKQHVVFKEH